MPQTKVRIGLVITSVSCIKYEHPLGLFGSKKMLDGPRYTCAFFRSEQAKRISSFAQETEVITGPILKLIGVAVMMLLITQAYSLPSDKTQAMHVMADSADLSQQKHEGIYTGHVEFTQGTTNLHAEKAITKGDSKNQLTLAIANGSHKAQAHYWTQSAPDKPPFHAYADTIRYYPLRHCIELIGHARIEQGTNSLSAAKITYDTLEQHVLSQSDGKTRTTIILYPEKKPT